jgi:hypothetical protein
VAKNARYKQIGFDGFEDYDFTTDCANPCRAHHFGYLETLGGSASVADSVSHSGRRSLAVRSGQSVTMVRDIKPDMNAGALAFDVTDSVYRLTANGCLPKFSPDSGRYYFSAWFKESEPCPAPSYSNGKVTISYVGSPDSYTFQPSGNRVEGWQRIAGTFYVPSSATQIAIELESLGGNVFFDDVRVQPFNSSMKSYVYDRRTLRLVAELDENNYATFYEYDSEGVLIRVKKETERGIMTVKETRSTLKRQ